MEALISGTDLPDTSMRLRRLENEYRASATMMHWLSQGSKVLNNDAELTQPIGFIGSTSESEIRNFTIQFGLAHSIIGL